MVVEKAGRISSWNWEQEKAFENALAIHPEGYIDLWEKIKLAVPGKTVEEIKQHYALLIEDINRIESGQVPLPNYVGAFYGSYDDGATAGKDEHNCEFNQEVKSKRREQERRKGRPWTEEEHRNFLRGIQVFGKGDWRSISRMFVKSRSPTQVASHAQKFYNRKKSSSKDRKRSSIHDIIDVSSGDTSAPQVPISGQADCPIAQPAEPLISADDTPNNLRIPAASQTPFNAIQNQVSTATMKHKMLQRHLH